MNTTLDHINFPLGLTCVLSPTELVVFSYLLYCQKKGYATSRNFLSRRCRISLSTVSRALRHLETLGFITKTNHRDDIGTNLPSTFTINTVAICAACEWE
jgi:DNA-binding MarR family transcriptional regulator